MMILIGLLLFLFFLGVLPFWQGAFFLALTMTVTNKFIPCGKGWKGLAVFLAAAQAFYIVFSIAIIILVGVFPLLAPVIFLLSLFFLFAHRKNLMAKFKEIGVSRYRAYGVCWGIGVFQNILPLLFLATR